MTACSTMSAVVLGNVRAQNHGQVMAFILGLITILGGIGLIAFDKDVEGLAGRRIVTDENGDMPEMLLRDLSDDPKNLRAGAILVDVVVSNDVLPVFQQEVGELGCYLEILIIFHGIIPSDVVTGARMYAFRA